MKKIWNIKQILQITYCCFLDSSDPGKITVQVHSKNITLPISTTTLTAYPIPDAPKDDPYSYEWALIDDETVEGGEGKGRSGVMESKTDQQLKLSKLEEGIYKFKVTVVGSQSSSQGIRGEAIGVVTVFPGKRYPKNIYFVSSYLN